MNMIEISITRFDDAKYACRAVISGFNWYPSHPRILEDWLERLLGCDMDGRVVWHAEDAMISVKVLV